jgi:hypothetical protein
MMIPPVRGICTSLSTRVQMRLALEVSRAGASRTIIMLNHPKRSYLERVAAVLASALKVAKVGVDFYLLYKTVR